MTTWNWVKFKDITSIANGQVDPLAEPYCNYLHIGPENIVSDSGRIQNLKTPKELGLISGKYLFDENAIVYSKIRPNLNKVCIPKFIGICSADAYPIWVKEDLVNRDYLFQFMLSPIFVKQSVEKSTRTGLPKINRDDLNSIKVFLPSLFTQKIIADILKKWDEAIAITEKLITAKRLLKQGLRQKVFFSDKSKSWKMYKLGDLFERITRKNDIGCEIVLTSSGEQGLINQKDFFNRRVASADLSGYYLMRKGEFAYNRSSMKGYPYGAIKRLDRYETAALSTLYVCFRLIQKDFSSNFFLYLFEAGVLNGEIYKIVNEGAR